MINDIGFILQWWLPIFIIGIVFFPVTSLIFSSFYDKGYFFGKVLGLALVSYLMLIIGVVHVIPFTYASVIGVVGFFLILNIVCVYLATKKGGLLSRLKDFFDVVPWRTVLFQEFLFLISLIFWSFIRGHEPTINGLEKFMDFGFVNSILRSDFFPPRDMWFTPESINYYYFGHLVTAVLTRLSALPSSITYNLMIATIFASAVVGSFSIGIQFFKKIRLRYVAGILSAFLLAFAGNLHVLYAFFEAYSPETPVPLWTLDFRPLSIIDNANGYWYPNATRFIFNTIHEFPIYSFVVSDLHGHVLSIPFVLLTIAVLLSMYVKKVVNVYWALLLSFLVAVLYMTNAMDGVVYTSLSLAVIFVLCLGGLDIRYGKRARNFFVLQTYINSVKNIRGVLLSFGVYSGIVVLGYVVFSFPFNAFFDPFVSGVGVLCAPKSLISATLVQGEIYGKLGPFLFEPDHCQRSPWWQLLTLYGFFIFFSVSLFVFYARAKKYVLDRLDHFVIILTLFSFFLLLIPEFFYAKDIYPDHYRANTMFKLAYQAFMMLSLVCGYSCVRIIIETRNKVFALVSVILVSLVLLYSYFAITSYYGNLQLYRGIDGTAYMQTRLADDYEVVQYLQKNVEGQPVLVEAQGDSYTDYNRISANTGVVNVLGWTVHEWLWRGTYDVVAPRIEEVRQIYEAPDMESIEGLLTKYKVVYIYFGNLEREKYPAISEDKFSESPDFEVVFESGNSRLYRRN